MKKSAKTNTSRQIFVDDDTWAKIIYKAAIEKKRIPEMAGELIKRALRHEKGC